MEAFVDSNGQAIILGDERVDVILLYLCFPAYDDRHGHSRFLARKQREDLFIRIGIDDEDAMFRFEKERAKESRASKDSPEKNALSFGRSPFI